MNLKTDVSYLKFHFSWLDKPEIKMLLVEQPELFGHWLNFCRLMAANQGIISLKNEQEIRATALSLGLNLKKFRKIFDQLMQLSNDFFLFSCSENQFSNKIMQECYENTMESRRTYRESKSRNSLQNNTDDPDFQMESAGNQHGIQKESTWNPSSLYKNKNKNKNKHNAHSAEKRGNGAAACSALPGLAEGVLQSFLADCRAGKIVTDGSGKVVQNFRALNAALGRLQKFGFDLNRAAAICLHYPTTVCVAAELTELAADKNHMIYFDRLISANKPPAELKARLLKLKNGGNGNAN